MKKQRIEKEEIRSEQRGAAFARELLRWNRYENNRSMPWKGEKDPYKIWLSEVILQQTRVEQGLKYYQNFISTFPDVHALASAPEEKVFKLWEGLGYYSRCRNLIHAAKYISEELKGRFPQTYEDILALKGVGAYTAAAIASFAYNQPYAVLDGNVFRVLSRIFDKEVPVDSTAGKKEYAALAQAVLPEQNAGEYNQAIMDFGATICKPSPLCDDCFFTQDCLAYLSGKQQLLPVKEKKLTLKKRWLNYFLVQCGNEMLIQQRTGKDIWQSLHQGFLIETERAFSSGALQQLFQQQSGFTQYHILQEWKKKQALSHQSICFHLFHVKVTRKKKVEGYQWVHRDELRQLAFPRTLQHIVEALFG
ncbi:MAG TPA: A/G-specific adenine glycosylase [Flavisolibacter sp.]|jgi:A/G-specific adenine glycosylase|nr:A/G-specific adenine glycosylase [Flavisolibacter sp.]